MIRMKFRRGVKKANMNTVKKVIVERDHENSPSVYSWCKKLLVKNKI
jgi:hypothetical protein